MTYLQDYIHALKGIAVPVVLILVGAMVLNLSTAPLSDRAAIGALAFFLSGIAWVVYLSFFSRD